MSMTRPVVAAMLFGTAMSAHADQLLLTFDGIGASRQLAIGSDSFLSSDSNAVLAFMDPIVVGENNWRNQHGSNVTAYSDGFDVSHHIGETLAFEVFDDLQDSDFTSEQLRLCSAQDARLDDLFCRYINLCSGGLSLDTRLVDMFDIDTHTSAVQRAIWEINHESLSESSLAIAQSQLASQLGGFRTPNNLDYSYASGDSEGATDFIFSSLGDDGWQSTQEDHLQDFSDQGSLNQITVVPLPIPAILAGTGFAFLAISRRRRRARDS